VLVRSHERSTTKIDSKNSLSPLRHFTEHLRTFNPVAQKHTQDSTCNKFHTIGNDKAAHMHFVEHLVCTSKNHYGQAAESLTHEDHTEEKNARMSCSYGRATNLDWEMKSCPARSVRRTKTTSTREEQTSKQTRLSANETALFWRFSAHNESKNKSRGQPQHAQNSLTKSIAWTRKNSSLARERHQQWLSQRYPARSWEMARANSRKPRSEPALGSNKQR
jgi:hypothetical protein